ADVTLTSTSSFEDYYLKEPLMKGLEHLHYRAPSPVQEMVIPLFLAGYSILIRSKNGTGKTAAFLIPMLEQIQTSARHVQALILTPSRELSMQVSYIAKQMGKYMDLRVLVATGGTNIRQDALRLYFQVQVVVGTPGRILDLCNRQIVLTSATFPERNQIFHDFLQGTYRVLVCSDLFARGIDVQEVNVVINFDFPSNTATYLHRIGRSGRFGNKGLAINLVTYADRFNLFKVEKELGVTIEPMPNNINPALYVY
uniref:RNA helicase n=1 Tax=Dermatophagoides pteronyssinus TaxID=6956 RepID=A0A6P6Y7Q7_DERPT